MTRFLTTAALVLGAALATPAQTVTDAQIAHIVVTANQIDVDAGALAIGRSTHDEVKKFAELMVRDHSGVNKAAAALAGKLGLTPQDNATSKSLKVGGEKNLTHLKSLSGRAFDKAYVDNEVAYHTAVLDALDKTLIPNSKTEALTALLVQTRPAFVAHLEHAKRLQSVFAR